MRAFRGIPPSATCETADMLMLEQELHLPDQLVNTETDHHDYSSYVLKLLERLEQAHSRPREKQLLIKNAASEEPPLFKPGDLVLLVNNRKRRGKTPSYNQDLLGHRSSPRALITIHIELRDRAKS